MDVVFLGSFFRPARAAIDGPCPSLLLALLILHGLILKALLLFTALPVESCFGLLSRCWCRSEFRAA